MAIKVIEISISFDRTGKANCEPLIAIHGNFFMASDWLSTIMKWNSGNYFFSTSWMSTIIMIHEKRAQKILIKRP